MKVLLFAPYSLSGGHHETDLEFAIGCLKRGDEVHVVYCNEELPVCDSNPLHDTLLCLQCKSTIRYSFERAGVPLTHLHTLSLGKGLEEIPIPHFKDIEELKRFSLEGIEAGLASASTLITLEHDAYPDVVKNRKYIVDSIGVFKKIYDAISKAIDTLKPDQFYVFNGRTVTLSAAFLAAQHKKIDTLVGERDNFRTYILLENASGVDIQFAKKSIDAFKKKMEKDPEAEKLANDWFIDNRNGNKEQLLNYLRQQLVGKVPPLDRTKHNVAIFTSTEWEVAAARGWEHPFFKDQTEGIKYILSKITVPSVHFYLRIHPNLGNFNNSQMRELASLHYPNLTIIQPGADIDTYALMEACDTVLTFGSTVGIEAAYWGKPSVLLGRAFWEGLGAVYIPQSRADALTLLTKKMEPKSRELALPYGYWWKRRGTAFQYIKPQNPFDKSPASMDGVTLGPDSWTQKVLLWKRRWARWTARFAHLLKEQL